MTEQANEQRVEEKLMRPNSPGIQCIEMFEIEEL
jgi:hypothetical protein